LAAGHGNRRYQIGETEQFPSFARLLFPDGKRSAPAIVTLIDRLRSSIRETHSRNTENALRQLDEETEASLALLDVLDVLERLDSDVATQKNPISVKRKLKAQEDEKNTSRYQTLSYEQFVAGRRPRTHKSQLVHNSLAGSETSVVREFLN